MEQLSPEALLQLAQYQPFRDDGMAMHAAFERMVPAVLMNSGGSLGGPEELRVAFQALFGVEVEPREIETWLGNLVAAGTLTRDGNKISVSASTNDSLEARRQEFEELAKSAEQDWRAAMIQEEPSVSGGELTALWREIDELIGLMVAYHGAEAAVILYPEESRSKELVETLEKQGARPKAGPERTAMSRKSVANFFLSPTQAQRRYLADRLDHGFFATVGTLRPSAGVTMRDEMAGHRLYLDTNVLIPCLGLAGSRHDVPAQRLLKLTSDLGVELAVTTKTLEEFRHSLKRTRAELEEDPPSRRYARLMRTEASRTSGSSLAEGYWEALEQNGTTIRDWFLRAEVVEPRLEKLGIEIVDDEVAAVVNRETKRVDAYLDLLGREATRRGRRHRDDHQLRHDALHRVLIERLRENQAETFRSARHWFLTEDKLLPEFGHVALPGDPRPQIPFCISAAAWAQIARCFTPRTDDYDQMITDLLASPYLSFGSLDLGEIQHVISRVATLMDDVSPTVLGAILGEEVLKAVAGKEQSEGDEILRKAYVHQEDRMKVQQEELEARIEEMEADLEQNRAEAGTISRLRKELEQQRVEHEETVEQLQHDQELVLEENSNLKGALDAARTADEDRRRAQRRAAWVAIGGLVLLALGVLTVARVFSSDVLVVGGASVAAAIVAPFLERSRFAWTAAFVLAVASVAVVVL